MRLFSFRQRSGDGLGVVGPDGQLWSSAALGTGLPATMAELLAGGAGGLEALRARAVSASEAPGTPR
jgi:hypothetical protein